MNLIPMFFVTFKVLVLSIGMFFAVKWHFDQGQKGKNDKTIAVVLTAAKVGTAFVLSAFFLLFVTFEVCRKLGLDLSM